MKKLFISLFAAVCLCACEKSPVLEESPVSKMYGDYKLVNIHWSGLPVDFNGDGTGRWDLLNEYKYMYGYYEPFHIAKVSVANVIDSRQSGSIVAFNVSIPYPWFTEEDGNYVITSVKYLHQTFRVNNPQPRMTNGYIKYDKENKYDLFLANLDNMSVSFDSYKDGKFTVRLYCSLPCVPAGDEKLSTNYMLLEYQKK